MSGDPSRYSCLFLCGVRSKPTLLWHASPVFFMTCSRGHIKPHQSTSLVFGAYAVHLTILKSSHHAKGIRVDDCRPFPMNQSDGERPHFSTLAGTLNIDMCMHGATHRESTVLPPPCKSNCTTAYTQAAYRDVGPASERQQIPLSRFLRLRNIGDSTHVSATNSRGKVQNPNSHSK